MNKDGGMSSETINSWCDDILRAAGRWKDAMSGVMLADENEHAAADKVVMAARDVMIERLRSFLQRVLNNDDF